MFIQISAVTCQRRGSGCYCRKISSTSPLYSLYVILSLIFTASHTCIFYVGAFLIWVEKTNKIQHKSLFSTKFLTNRPERCRTIAICALCRLFSNNLSKIHRNVKVLKFKFSAKSYLTITICAPGWLFSKHCFNQNVHANYDCLFLIQKFLILRQQLSAKVFTPCRDFTFYQNSCDSCLDN